MPSTLQSSASHMVWEVPTLLRALREAAGVEEGFPRPPTTSIPTSLSLRMMKEKKETIESVCGVLFFDAIGVVAVESCGVY